LPSPPHFGRTIDREITAPVLKTAAGLARLRAAKTKHGRYSAKHRALQRMLHTYERDGIESARTFPVREFRSELLRRAREPLSCEVVNYLRDLVKRDLEAKEQLRLGRWCHKED
jgi:hypothetical protein